MSVPTPMTRRARPPRRDLTVRATPAGLRAQQVWRPLPGVVEKRWQERFGHEALGRSGGIAAGRGRQARWRAARLHADPGLRAADRRSRAPIAARGRIRSPACRCCCPGCCSRAPRSSSASRTSPWRSAPTCCGFSIRQVLGSATCHCSPGCRKRRSAWRWASRANRVSPCWSRIPRAAGARWPASPAPARAPRTAAAGCSRRSRTVGRIASAPPASWPAPGARSPGHRAARAAVAAVAGTGALPRRLAGVGPQAADAAALPHGAAPRRLPRRQLNRRGRGQPLVLTPVSPMRQVMFRPDCLAW